METPHLNIGIFTRNTVTFRFDGEYVHRETGQFLQGIQKASLVNGKVWFNGKAYHEVFFEPASDDVSFELKNVTIGVNFHWQREEDQQFKGALNLIATGEGIVAVNQTNIESYLCSVISSEMNAQAPREFLKAHAVISRSWVLSQIRKSQSHRKQAETAGRTTDTGDSRIRWYDREDHTLFDVCADDHCQRYQGVTRETHPQIARIIEQTKGEVLMFGDDLCDARFSKCCGGATERFSTCWENTDYPYLPAQGDNPDGSLPADLSGEAAAQNWIHSAPDAFCNTHDEALLRRVLNGYDCETPDFYRWKVTYAQEELARLVRDKSGIDFGDIIDLIPVKRGSSGRIEELSIHGSKRTLTIGKELEIRRTLSETHLYSSAFTVEKTYGEKGNIPTAFILCGAGWGHGVGLCQIGAAVMSTQGYDYRQILQHYFPGSNLTKYY